MMISKYSEGCYRIQGRAVTSSDIAMALADARKNKLRRARICMHYDVNDTIQRMIVVLMFDSPKGTYKYNKAASFMLMEGEMDVDFFSEAGEFMHSYKIDKQTPFLAIEAGVYHRPTIKSDYIILYETHLGPWDKNYMTRPEWAPA